MKGFEEQYMTEQIKDTLSRYCYEIGQHFWKKAKDSLSRKKNSDPFVYYDSKKREHVFCTGETDEETNVLFASCEQDSENNIVITPMQFHENFQQFMERQVDEKIIAFTIGRELEKDISYQIKKTQFEILELAFKNQFIKRQSFFFMDYDPVQNDQYPKIVRSILKQVIENTQKRRGSLEC